MTQGATATGRRNSRGTATSAALSRKATRDEKRREILAIARDQFLASGYAGTSMDSIVEATGGSKATLYNYFESKELLFVEVIATVTHSDDPREFGPPGHSVEEELFAFARDRIGRVVSDRNIGIMRLVIAEAQRLPEIAQHYFRRGPEPSYRALEAYLREAVEAGNLAIDDFEIATQELMGELLLLPMLSRLFGVGAEPTADLLDERVRALVQRFMARYAS